jgi:alpha-D-glucose phosphate-specific phosphoglucomutase
MQTISFGTSGWRGLLAEDFTFANVRAVTQAIAEYVRDEGPASRPVVVAHDTRFLAEEFGRAVAEVLAGNAIAVILSRHPYPTPAVAWEILQRGAAAAVNVTASHNPHPWNGIKFSPSSAGPALPETTARIEKRANALLADPAAVRRATSEQWRGLVREEVLGHAYREQIGRLVDLAAVGKRRMRVVVDPLHGTSAGLLDSILAGAGAEVIVQHDRRDPYFGGGRPEPEGVSLVPLVERVRREKAQLGLATDCDADRFGVVDADGTYFSPNLVLSLLVGYLAETRGWQGRVGRSVATTQLVDLAARDAGLDVVETAVGFKFLGDLLIRGEIVMAAEESGGLAISGHVPDKDGILACLLAAEMVARRGKSLRQLLDDLFARVGARYPERRDFSWSGGKPALEKCLAKVGARLAGRRIVDTVDLDGKKFVLEDGSWALARASGTEPIIRLYVESAEKARGGALLDAFATALGIDAASAVG